MAGEMQTSFLKWFEIQGIVRNKKMSPTMIACALSTADFKMIVSAGIRSCFDTLCDTNPLIDNVHIALKQAATKLESAKSKNDNKHDKNHLISKSPFDIEDLHFKIFEFLDFKCLMKCSCVDKNWLYKTYDTRSTYSLDFEKHSYDLLKHVRNIYLRFCFVKKIRLCPWNENNKKLNQLFSNVAKFNKIKQLIIGPKKQTTKFYRYIHCNFNHKYNAAVKDILSNNSSIIETLSIEVCKANALIHQHLQEKTIARFANLREININSNENDRGDMVAMCIDKILSIIISTARNLKNVSFSVEPNEFLNDKLEFTFNNDNNNLNGLDCVTILAKTKNLTGKQVENITRLLCCGGSDDLTSREVITKKLLFQLNGDDHVTSYKVAAMFVKHLRLLCAMGDDLVGPKRLKHLAIKFLGHDDSETSNSSAETNGTVMLSLLDELNKLTKVQKQVAVQIQAQHRTKSIYQFHTSTKQDTTVAGKTKFQTLNCGYDWEYANGPSFEQFCQICDLMQQINNNSYNNVKHSIAVELMFEYKKAAQEITRKDNKIWDLKKLGLKRDNIYDNRKKKENGQNQGEFYFQHRQETAENESGFEKCWNLDIGHELSMSDECTYWLSCDSFNTICVFVNGFPWHRIVIRSGHPVQLVDR